ncbi:MAG TPA: hypothetical protein VIY28_05445 [Pseudonocardiaceae bacterium]
MSAPSVMLVRYRAAIASQSACTVHLVPLPGGREAGAVSALCGALLRVEEIETVAAGQGAPCTMCVLDQVAATALDADPPVDSPDTAGAMLLGGDAYRTWGWPVIQHRDQIWLSLHGDVSAVAIPTLLGAGVTQILIAQHCAPAVLAHPDLPEHRIVLAGERFGATLPWPPEVHQVIGALMLPPTVTPRGPISWIQPPHKDSLRLSREIDVFGALRTVFSDFPPDEDRVPASGLPA